MTIEIVDFPIENGGTFHSYVNVYQRVYRLWAYPLIFFSPYMVLKKWAKHICDRYHLVI